MGAPSKPRDEPGWASVLAIVGALGQPLASGCGSVSLDATPAAATGSSTTGASTTGMPTSADDTSTTGSDAPPDVPAVLPDLPPPGSCPAECVVDLPLVWTWEDEPLPERPPDPLDPTGRRPERHLSAMVRAPGGSLMVADRRDGEVWITGVSHDGALAWGKAIFLACDCEIVELGFTAGGQFLVLGEGIYQGLPSFVLAAYLPTGSDVIFNWRVAVPIYGSSERPGRVGSLIPLPDDSVAVLVVETGLGGNMLEKDWYEIQYYVNGSQEGLWLLDTQLGTGPLRRPRGVVLPRFELATTFAGGTGMDDYVAWMAGWSSFVIGVQPLPGLVDAMAAGPDGAIVAAGIDGATPARPRLWAAGLPRGNPPAWLHSADVPGSTASAPVLTMDADGNAYLALRTTDGSGEPQVMLERLDPDGALVWSTTLPLAASDSPAPIALSLADDDRDLVLAAIVDGRLHLERREQGCRCD